MTDLLQSVNGKVVNKKGELVDVGSLKGQGKFIGIYFSAHWCPPCRSFTPVLAEFYNKIKATDKASQFEIIFVSCDRDQDSFDAYFNEMPWCAVSFDHEDVRGSLNQAANVTGIPHFTILNGEGQVHIQNARNSVTNESATFLWD